MKMGYDDNDFKVVEEILKRKNVEITLLKKQLKIPSTEDPQAKEIKEDEHHKEDMLKLIIEQMYRSRRWRRK